MSYRVGIDVGEKSVGWAVIEFDDDDFAIDVLSMGSAIHDGGSDPNSGESAVSRLASAGVARRTRRLVRRRRARLRRLAALLEASGMPADPIAPDGTYGAWMARDRLSREFIADPIERGRLLNRAVMHIARHRGWRNPWHGYARLLEGSDERSDNLEATLARARELVPGSAVEISTLGQAVALVLRSHGNQVTIRPRGGTEEYLMREQVLASDQLAELQLILEQQQIDDATADQICQEAFFAVKASVPKSRVGPDVLTGLPRASRGLLEFQEFRIRAFAANLRIGKGSAKRPLERDEYDSVVAGLLAWRDATAPKVADVADMLGVRPSQLNRDLVDQAAVTAPTDDTSAKVEAALNRRHPLRAWWDSASSAARAEWIAAISDPVVGYAVDEDLVSEPFEIADESVEVVEDVAKLAEKLGGRIAYSRESLQRMLPIMRETGCDEFTARMRAFDLGPDWRPPLPTLSDYVEHPTVQRVNAIIRRLLANCVQRWGTPDRVVVEHVRSAFFGPTALAEFRSEQNRNRARNEARRTELAGQGVERPTMSDVRRYEAIQRQNSNCLYCGDEIGMATSEMDHIVPDSLGGENTRDNLVAVCRACNAQKGKSSFVEFCARTNRPGVSVPEAVDRVKSWQRIPPQGTAQLRSLKRDVIRRLSMTSEDLADLDLRSLESTAYAAVEMRRRIAGTLGINERDVHVYRGAVTNEARRASGIDSMLALRGEHAKSRFDRRHHAIDAAVITTLTPLTARTLAERSALQLAERYDSTQPTGWRDYSGRTPNAQEDFASWKQRAGSVADAVLACLQADRIAVTRPLRLTTRAGAIHKASIRPLARKELASEWTPQEIDRIVDPEVYGVMTDLLGSAKRLGPDPQRRIDGVRDAEVALFPGNGAQIAIRGGAADLTAVHHARIYAWATPGGIRYGQVRVFSHDAHQLGGGDVLTAALPVDSASWRTANRAVRERMLTGTAVRIGWLAPGDELEIDPGHDGFQNGKLGAFLSELRENRWAVSGFFDDGRVSLVPSYLAAEGLPDRFKAAADRSEAQKAVQQILEQNRIPLAINVILQDPSLVVVRRTALGRPRWKSNSLPVSWQPSKVARALLRP